MILMAIDHIRDYIARSACSFLPSDLGRTTAAIFLLAGSPISARRFSCSRPVSRISLDESGHRSKGELARFLISRGVWLIFLELTVLRVIGFFSDQLPCESL